MALIAALIVVVTLVVMTTGAVPAVLALTTALVVAGIVGIATPAELFAGLSNGGVITIAAMLVIAKGVLHTGAVSRLTHLLLSGVRTSGQVLRRLIPSVGLVSALINTTPIVAMLIPAAKELQQRTGIPARGLLLPVAHATTLAGSATLIGTSSNLLIAGLAEPDGVHLTMFSFVPIAVPVAVVGWAVLMVTAPRMLGGRPDTPERELSWQAEIPVSARALAIGRTAPEMEVASTAEFELVEIRRWGDHVDADVPLQAGDTLVFRSTEGGVRMLWANPVFGLAPQRLFLVAIATSEQKSVRDLEEDEDVVVIAAQTTGLLREAPAEPGELCLVTAESADALAENPLVALWRELEGTAPQTAKTWLAVAILVGTIVSASFGLAAVKLCAVAGGNSLMVVLVLVFVVGTTLLTNAVTNAAAAAILTPIALEVAAVVGLNPVLLLTLIGTCISFTFLNPYSHQSNLMVMRPGGYSSRTFLRFGVPLTLAAAATAIGVGWSLLTFVG